MARAYAATNDVLAYMYNKVISTHTSNSQFGQLLMAS